MKSVPSLSLAVVLSLAACNAGSAPSEAAQPAIEAHVQDVDPDAEKPAERTAETPTLQVKTLDGADYSLAAHRGKWVVVNFWATWCPPCVEELPLLDAFYRENSAKGWQVLGVAIDRVEAVQVFLRKTSVTFPVAMAGLGGTELGRTFGNQAGGLPFTVVLGADGTVAHRKMGQITHQDLATWAAAGSA